LRRKLFAALACGLSGDGAAGAGWLSCDPRLLRRATASPCNRPISAESLSGTSHWPAIAIWCAKVECPSKGQKTLKRIATAKRDKECAPQQGHKMARATIKIFLLVTTAAFGLAACQSGSNPFGSNDNSDESTTAVASETSVRLVDRDVEAPQVFQVNDDALWDGRPSLGGVWVASPDATDPERVILRNPGNGKFVIGALFRRERINPGPALQISSDAAAALDILAGRPTKINVTALRREEIKAETPDAARPILDANETVSTSSLDAVSTASAALDKVAPPKPAAPIKPAPTNPAAAKTGGNGQIQIGIFSVEANADRASGTLTKAGIPASVSKGNSQGKDFWRVTATATSARDATLAKVKGLGFTDAYFLSR
jgi:cell division septation protein DedD